MTRSIYKRSYRCEFPSWVTLMLTGGGGGLYGMDPRSPMKKWTKGREGSMWISTVNSVSMKRYKVRLTATKPGVELILL